MKYQPYSEIINLEKELKEYKKLCKGKSKEFRYFSEWESHIKRLMSTIDDEEKLKNLKHYLINLERSAKSIPSHYFEIMLLVLTLILDRIGISYWGLLLVLLVFVFYTLSQNDEYTKNYNFYCDVISIISELENSVTLHN